MLNQREREKYNKHNNVLEIIFQTAYSGPGSAVTVTSTDTLLVMMCQNLLPTNIRSNSTKVILELPALSTILQIPVINSTLIDYCVKSLCYIY